MGAPLVSIGVDAHKVQVGAGCLCQPVAALVAIVRILVPPVNSTITCTQQTRHGGWWVQTRMADWLSKEARTRGGGQPLAVGGCCIMPHCSTRLPNSRCVGVVLTNTTCNCTKLGCQYRSAVKNAVADHTCHFMMPVLHSLW